MDSKAVSNVISTILMVAIFQERDWKAKAVGISGLVYVQVGGMMNNRPPPPSLALITADIGETEIQFLHTGGNSLENWQIKKDEEVLLTGEEWTIGQIKTIDISGINKTCQIMIFDMYKNSQMRLCFNYKLDIE